MPKASLTENIKTRVDAELKAAIERQAAKEGREPAQLIRNTLRDAMVAAGQLEAAVTRG